MPPSTRAAHNSSAICAKPSTQIAPRTVLDDLWTCLSEESDIYLSRTKLCASIDAEAGDTPHFENKKNPSRTSSSELWEEPSISLTSSTPHFKNPLFFSLWIKQTLLHIKSCKIWMDMTLHSWVFGIPWIKLALTKWSWDRWRLCKIFSWL
jgi:hypothetical protein